MTWDKAGINSLSKASRSEAFVGFDNAYMKCIVPLLKDETLEITVSLTHIC